MKARSTIYIILAWIIIVASIIVGIILGGTNTVKELTFDSSASVFNNSTESFNVSLMLYTWLGGFTLSILTMGIGSICHRLDLLIDKEK